MQKLYYILAFVLGIQTSTSASTNFGRNLDPNTEFTADLPPTGHTWTQTVPFIFIGLMRLIHDYAGNTI